LGIVPFLIDFYGSSNVVVLVFGHVVSSLQAPGKHSGGIHELLAVTQQQIVVIYSRISRIKMNHGKPRHSGIPVNFLRWNLGKPEISDAQKKQKQKEETFHGNKETALNSSFFFFF
jgi:hypothetical protein